MKQYISILRGINVSGKRKIKMADLKAVYEKLGFSAIKTYIQSGNVVFKSPLELTNKNIEQQIAQAILENYGFEVPVLIRSSEEIKHTLSINPFLQEASLDTKKLYVTFLAETPAATNIEKIKSLQYPPDKFEIIGQEIFLYVEKYGKTKLSNNFFEKKLKLTATTRNWRTVNKLQEMGMD